MLALLLIAASASDDPPLRLPAINAEGVPRGVVTVTVPLPAELRDEPSVTFEVRAPGEIEVLGRRQGIAAAPGVPARPVVLTLRIPAGTEAGAYDGAEVYFKSDRGREVVVPVSVRIGFVRDLALSGPREMRGLRLGDRLHLVYVVSNAGNGADTLRVNLVAPPGWPVRLAGPPVIVVPARGRIEIGVLATAPGTANVGDHLLALSLRELDGRTPLATWHTTLGLVGRAGQSPGLMLRPLLAVASAPGQTAIQSGFTLEGPVAEGVQLRTQVTPNTSVGGTATQGLASVGAAATPFSALLIGPGYDVSAGHVGVQLGELAGVNVMGRGVIANVEREGWRGRGLVARSGLGAGAGSGLLFGATASQLTAIGRVGGGVSRLEEQGGTGFARSLTALGMDLTSHPVGEFVFGTSLAYRATPHEEGVGYGFSVGYESPGERGSVRFVHAPGGTAGFARATDEMQFDYAIELGQRWSADIATQFAEDRGAVFDRMRNTAWAFGTRFTPSSDLQLSLRASDSRFDVRTPGLAGGDFGATHQDVTLLGEWRRDRLGLSVEGSLGSVGRITGLASGGTHSSEAPQRGLRAGATRAFEHWGDLDAHIGVSATGGGVGLPGQSFSTSVRWANVPVSLLDRSIRFSTELSHQQLGALASALVFRSTATVVLPAGLELALSVERNPFFRTPRGDASWILATRLSGSAKVRSTEPFGPHGVVFEDLDLDGVRDPEEPGIGGVHVHRGEVRVRTARDGTFRFPVSARGATRIEQASLPLGLLAHPGVPGEVDERLDLAVVATGSVFLELVLVADAEGRVPDVDLAPAVVILRDRTGFEWVGRKVRADLVSFDRIPVGDYTVVFNSTRLREPLRIEDSKVTIVAGKSPTLALPLHRRAIRTFTPPGARTRSTGPSGRGP